MYIVPGSIILRYHSSGGFAFDYVLEGSYESPVLDRVSAESRYLWLRECQGECALLLSLK